MASDPTFITKSAELADAMQPTHAEAADWAREYHARKNLKSVVTGDGEPADPYENERQAKRLNEALKKYIEQHGPLQVEGLPALMLQPSTSETVDVQSLAERDRATVDRLIDHGAMRVDMATLDRLEKAGLITGVPRMPIGGTPRLVWEKRR